jgi:hypothetical protein
VIVIVDHPPGKRDADQLLKLLRRPIRLSEGIAIPGVDNLIAVDTFIPTAAISYSKSAMARSGSVPNRWPFIEPRLARPTP